MKIVQPIREYGWSNWFSYNFMIETGGLVMTLLKDGEIDISVGEIDYDEKELMTFIYNDEVEDDN